MTHPLIFILWLKTPSNGSINPKLKYQKYFYFYLFSHIKMGKESVQKMLKMNLWKKEFILKVLREECVDFYQTKSVNTLFLVINTFLKLINLFKSQDLGLVIGREEMDLRIITFLCDENYYVFMWYWWSLIIILSKIMFVFTFV